MLRAVRDRATYLKRVTKVLGSRMCESFLYMLPGLAQFCSPVMKQVVRDLLTQMTDQWLNEFSLEEVHIKSRHAGCENFLSRLLIAASPKFYAKRLNLVALYFQHGHVAEAANLLHEKPWRQKN